MCPPSRSSTVSDLSTSDTSACRNVIVNATSPSTWPPRSQYPTPCLYTTTGRTGPDVKAADVKPAGKEAPARAAADVAVAVLDFEVNPASPFTVVWGQALTDLVQMNRRVLKDGLLQGGRLVVVPDTRLASVRGLRD